MSKTTGSATKASKSLSGVHNEINNVSENDSNGGNQTISPSMDLSKMDSSINTWIDKVKSKLAPLASIGQNVGNAFSKAWENEKGIEGIENLKNSFKNVSEIASSVIDTIKEWTASESFQFLANSMISIFNTLSYWIELITQKLKEIWENGGKETFEKLLGFISKVVQAIDEILKYLTPVIEYILSYVQPVIEGIIQAVGFILDALSGLLDFIIGIFQRRLGESMEWNMRLFLWNMECYTSIIRNRFEFYGTPMERYLEWTKNYSYNNMEWNM